MFKCLFLDKDFYWFEISEVYYSMIDFKSVKNYLFLNVESNKLKI